jgi:aminoglycoside phosphotransferase (APT) family kinase protein
MSQDRIAAGLAHWPALAAQAGLPTDGWTPRLLASRKDGKGNRIVLRLDHALHPPVVCKQSLNPADIAATRSTVRSQTAASRALAGNPDAGVPAIVASLPEQGVFAMTAVDGETLALLAEPGPPPDALRRAGIWVDAFHRIGPVEPRSFQPRFIVNHLLRLRDGPRAIAQRGRFGALVDRLAARAPAVTGAATVSSLRHGDLNARNILIAPDRVWGIDLAGAETGPVGYDIARLLVDLAERIPDTEPAGIGAGFFTGYSLTRADDATIPFLILARLLSNWAGMPAEEERMTLLQTLRFHRIRALAEAGFA